jgi:hypothetical protein
MWDPENKKKRSTCSLRSVSCWREAVRESRASPLGGAVLREVLRATDELREEETLGAAAERAVAPGLEGGIRRAGGVALLGGEVVLAIN